MTKAGTDKAHKPRVVIVGAGFGGLYAARELNRADIHLTVVERHSRRLGAWAYFAGRREARLVIGNVDGYLHPGQERTMRQAAGREL